MVFSTPFNPTLALIHPLPTHSASLPLRPPCCPPPPPPTQPHQPRHSTPPHAPPHRHSFPPHPTSCVLCCPLPCFTSAHPAHPPHFLPRPCPFRPTLLRPLPPPLHLSSPLPCPPLPFPPCSSPHLPLPVLPCACPCLPIPCAPCPYPRLFPRQLPECGCQVASPRLSQLLLCRHDACLPRRH
ncbi:unnamed protein product [Closterium sp. NIES-54]